MIDKHRQWLKQRQGSRYLFAKNEKDITQTWELDYQDEKYDKNINLVEIKEDETVIEFDEKNIEDVRNKLDKGKIRKSTKEQRLKWANEVIGNLEKENIGYSMYDHGGKSPHIHINLSRTAIKEEKEAIIKYYIPKESVDFVDTSLCGVHLISVPFAKHWKYGTIKRLVKEKSGLLIDVNNQKYKIVVINSQELPINESGSGITAQIVSKVKISELAVASGAKKGSGTSKYHCCFHNDEKPSLSLNDKKGWFKCFACGKEGNIVDFVAEADKISKEEAIKKLKEKAGIEDIKKGNNDLKTFIFDKNEIIQTRVFSSHLLTDSIFGFGLLLPREEDITDKKGNNLGKTQAWRPVSITSDRRGLAYGNWFQNDYKIKFEEIPFDMRLRWELSDIDIYLHKTPEKVSGKDLLDSIKKQYEYYLYFREPLWYDIHALWDIGTYLHQLFSAYPIFENRGLTGTAKTKTMSVSSCITLNATDIMINPSEATLFRETESVRPTKYIDEAEKLFRWTKEGMESDSRVELINASYTRNGAVLRQEKQGNKYLTKRYHCYSPTMISSITGLFGATENRAITQIHIKSPDNDKRGESDPEDDLADVKWKKIRDKCYLFALQNWKMIYEEYLTFKIGNNKEGKEFGIKKRDLQLWKPILVLAKIIDTKLYEDLLLFAEKISKLRRADLLSEGTVDYKVLNAVRDILLSEYYKLEGDNKIYVEKIRMTLNINGGYGSSDKDKGYNKTISSHLDKLGFKDYRNFDTNKGSYFEITIPIFNSITDLQCPQLSIIDKTDKQEKLL